MAAPQSNVQTYTANKVAVRFNDAEVGAAQNAKISMSVGLDGVSGIGSMLMKEYAPTVARVTVTSDQSYIFNQEIERLGDIVHLTPTASLNGLVFDISASNLVYSNSAYKTLNNVRGYKIIWTATKCLLDNGDFSTAKHGVVGRRCTWQAISWRIGDATAEMFA